MRYDSEHKAKTHAKIVKDASRQFRAEGLNGLGVASLMKASGLTVGGFYKHFGSKDDLLLEAVEESVHDIGSQVLEWASQAPAGSGWKEIVTKYLSLQHCDGVEWGCPTAALAADIARTSVHMKKKLAHSMEEYWAQLVHFMPGDTPSERESNWAVIYSTMVGAVTVARTMTSKAAKLRLLNTVRDHLLGSY
jgi:TetR/AcrR family transcriptional repressor of nem operon